MTGSDETAGQAARTTSTYGAVAAQAWPQARRVGRRARLMERETGSEKETR